MTRNGLISDDATLRNSTHDRNATWLKIFFDRAILAGVVITWLLGHR